MPSAKPIMMTMEALGGSAAPMPPLPASTVAARAGDQPVRASDGRVEEALEAVLAELDPDRAPKTAEPAVAMKAGPARIRPKAEFRMARIFWISPVMSIR